MKEFFTGGQPPNYSGWPQRQFDVACCAETVITCAPMAAANRRHWLWSRGREALDNLTPPVVMAGIWAFKGLQFGLTGFVLTGALVGVARHVVERFVSVDFASGWEKFGMFIAVLSAGLCLGGMVSAAELPLLGSAAASILLHGWPGYMRWIDMEQPSRAYPPTGCDQPCETCTQAAIANLPWSSGSPNDV